jgi:hypothetical protein
MGQRPFTYQWFKEGVAIPGASSDTHSLAAAREEDAGAYSVVVTNGLGAATSDLLTLAVSPAPALSQAFLSRVSARSWLTGNDANLTLGFVLQGDTPKPVVLRAIGPSLTLLGMADAAPDPRLAVSDGTGSAVAENDNWASADGPVFAAVGAFPLPEGSADAGLTLMASPGAGAAHVTAATSGMVLAEIYHGAASASSKIVNASARGLVGPDSQMLFCGFSVSGSANRRLLIRALGPQLADFGVKASLAAPMLEVYDQAGVEIAANAGWDVTLEPSYASAGAPRLRAGSRDAAVVVTVDAGSSCTAVVWSGDGSTGEAVLEIYELP